MNIKVTYSMALVLLAAVACVRVEPGLRYGELSVALTAGPSVEAVSKAAAEDVTPEECVISIFNVDGTAAAEPFGYTAPEKKMLPFGTYYVTAENCTAAESEAGYGRRRVAGRSMDVTISEEHLRQTAAVTCEVTNARVAVVFDASTYAVDNQTASRFPDGLKVTLSDGSRALEISQTAVGEEVVTWFTSGREVTYTIAGEYRYENIVSAVNHSAKITFEEGARTELKAKDNVQIIVKFSSEKGQLVPAVAFDNNIDESEMKPGFNPYE